MSRSFLQPSPSKKSLNEYNLNQSPLKTIRNNMTNYTEIIIQTNDQQVPFVSIFKPNIKKQQRRIQSILGLQKNLKKAEINRINFAFLKISMVKYRWQHHLVKVTNLQYLLQKIVKKRLSKSFFHVLSNKVKKNHLNIALKMLNFFQSSHKLNITKYAINTLKINHYRSRVLSLQNENNIALELAEVKKQLFKQKEESFSKQIIAQCKIPLKIIDCEMFIKNTTEECNLQQAIKLQLKRFQEARQTIIPKRKEQFDNQILLNLLQKTNRFYKQTFTKQKQREVQLKDIIEGYRNKEGIVQLNQIIASKQALLNEYENFFVQIFKFDSQLKKNEKQTIQKLLNLLSSHQKRMQIKVYQQNSLFQKIWNSRLFLHNLIINIVKKLQSQKQIINKGITQLSQNIHQQNQLTNYIRKNKSNSSFKNIAQFTLNLHEKVNNLSSQIQQLHMNNEAQSQSIDKLASFMRQSEYKVIHGQQINLQIINNLAVNNLQPVLENYLQILQRNKILQNENKQHLKQIDLLQSRGFIPYSQTKPFGQLLVTPKKNKLQSKQSQLSQLADNFLSPLKELAQNRKDDTQLKNIMIECRLKIIELINSSHSLQQKLIGLEKNDRVLQELRNKNNQYIQQIRQFQKQGAQFCMNISNYQSKIRQLTFANGQLNQQNRSLKESFNNIANSNMDLSQKINQIYYKSIIQNRQQQQLLKQTQLMKQIIDHKIQFQKITMSHFKQVQSLRNQINSYKTIITKLQTDLILRQNQNAQLQSTIKSITTKYQEIKELNVDYKNKIEDNERVRNVQYSNKFKEDQSELTKLKNQCNHIYQQLQRSAQSINHKNYQLHSLEIKLFQQDKIIAGLKQERQKINNDFQELLVQYSTSQQQISKYKLEINQIKTQYNSVQFDYSKNEANYVNMSQNYQHLQNQLHQKQITINNLIEQAKHSNLSFASQLLQSRNQCSNMQKLLLSKISEKDVKFSRLQFELNQKLNTITSLEQLISLHANNEDQLKKELDSMKHQYSRDKQIQYLCQQIKSLQEFVSEITLQYHQLQLRYQQERQRTNRSFTSFTPQKHSDINHYNNYRQSSSEQTKNHGKMQSLHISNIIQNQNDISMQLDKLLANNENLSYSVDFLRQENKELFMKVKNISSTQFIIQLLYNILLNISKLRAEQPEAVQLWEDLCRVRAEYTGQNLFANLQSYCSNFISKYSKR